MAVTPGTRLGPYEIGAPLGAGGIGEVYKARDTRLDRGRCHQGPVPAQTLCRVPVYVVEIGCQAAFILVLRAHVGWPLRELLADVLRGGHDPSLNNSSTIAIA